MTTMRRIAACLALFAAAVGVSWGVLAVSGCEQPQEERTGHRHWAVTYDVYCARKYTAMQAAEVGLVSGCLSPRPPAASLGTVTLPDGTSYRGDEASGLVCDACAKIEAVRRLWSEADASAPLMMQNPKPVMGTFTVGGELWSVDKDNRTWKLINGAMVEQVMGVPAEYPVK